VLMYLLIQRRVHNKLRIQGFKDSRGQGVKGFAHVPVHEVKEERVKGKGQGFRGLGIQNSIFDIRYSMLDVRCSRIQGFEG